MPINVPTILDTQVVSYMMKGRLPGPDPVSHVITSTVAHELLRMRDKSSGSPRYFLPGHASHAEYATLPVLATAHPTNRPVFKRRADRISIDFNGDLPSVQEYSHLGISLAINRRDVRIFRASIRHLPKQDRKTLVAIFEYLIATGLRCLPLDETGIRTGLVQLERFTATGGNAKKDFRNTLNDMLILGVALRHNHRIYTLDKELTRVASPQFHARTADGALFSLEPRQGPKGERKISNESKGFINRGWQYRTYSKRG
jgi:predicted nucleic acid-binding protein